MTLLASDDRPSLERLVEGAGLELETLHPGEARITDELAQLCEIGRGARVLDAASGTGESACHLFERLEASVVGVDVSDSMLERAKAKAERRGVRVELVRGDAQALPFSEGEFDAAISECTLCLLDKSKAVTEMTRVVKPGGRVGMHDLCWKDNTPRRLRDELARIEGERPETLEGWKALFEGSGLTEVRTVDRSSVIPDWVKRLRRQLGLLGQMKIFLHVLRRWGLRGLRDVLESEKIMGSPHTGYGIVVGRKASRA